MILRRHGNTFARISTPRKDCRRSRGQVAKVTNGTELGDFNTDFLDLDSQFIENRSLMLGVVCSRDQHQYLSRQIVQVRAVRVLVLRAEVSHDALEINLEIEGPLAYWKMLVSGHPEISERFRQGLRPWTSLKIKESNDQIIYIIFANANALQTPGSGARRTGSTSPRNRL